MAEAVYFENGINTLRPVDLETSRLFTREAKEGMCYANSLLALPRISKDVSYVEGYAIFYNNKIFNLYHHGWLERDGIIIDTYPGLGVRYEVIYFLGKRYTYEQAMRKKSLPSLHLKPLIFAIKTYHKATGEKGSWFFTAAKLALLFAGV